jgi:hypothetical protein
MNAAALDHIAAEPFARKISGCLAVQFLLCYFDANSTKNPTIGAPANFRRARKVAAEWVY